MRCEENNHRFPLLMGVHFVAVTVVTVPIDWTVCYAKLIYKWFMLSMCGFHDIQRMLDYPTS